MGNAEYRVVDALALQSAVAEDLPGLHPHEGRLGRQMMTDLTDQLHSSPSDTAEVSSSQRAGGIAELLLLSVWVWFYVLAQTTS